MATQTVATYTAARPHPRAARSLAKLALVFAAVLVLTHVAFSALASLVTKGLEEHRLTDVRNLPSIVGPEATGLIASFIQSRLDSRPTVAVVGSSFSWGYSWEEAAIYTYHLQSRLGDKYNVVNLSIYGGSSQTTFNTLSIMKRLGIRTEYLVVELNPANLAFDLKISSRARFPDVDLRPTAKYAPPYFSYFLSHLFGTEFIKIVFNQYNYSQNESGFSFVPLPKDYYLTAQLLEDKEQIARSIIGQILEQASAISPNVYLFFSPHFFEGVRQTGHDEAEVRDAYAPLMRACLDTGRATCLDFRDFQQRAHYRDVSHLNKRGHAAFAVELKRKLGL